MSPLVFGEADPRLWNGCADCGHDRNDHELHGCRADCPRPPSGCDRHGSASDRCDCWAYRLNPDGSGE